MGKVLPMNMTGRDESGNTKSMVFCCSGGNIASVQL